jgi:hypothetical protein
MKAQIRSQFQAQCIGSLSHGKRNERIGTSAANLKMNREKSNSENQNRTVEKIVRKDSCVQGIPPISFLPLFCSLKRWPEAGVKKHQPRALLVRFCLGKLDLPSANRPQFVKFL